MFIHLPVKHFHFNHNNTEFYKNTHALIKAASANVNTHKTEIAHVKSLSMQMKIEMRSAQNSHGYRKNTIVSAKDSNKPIWHEEIINLRQQVHKELAGKVSGVHSKTGQ